MTEIFANISVADVREIRYLNYLTTVVSEKALEKIISCEKVKQLQKEYQKIFSAAKLVLVPNQSFLQKTSFNFSERSFLKNPNKMLKDLKRVEQYFYVYNIHDLDLVVLDETLSDAFKSGTKDWEGKIIILNRSTRFAQYKDIVYGINSNQCKYLDKLCFGQYMQAELRRLYKKEETLRKYAIYYILGTTAVSTKGFVL